MTLADVFEVPWHFPDLTVHPFGEVVRQRLVRIDSNPRFLVNYDLRVGLARRRALWKAAVS